ncbi:hypothetical protein C8R47DRAFT_85905 [Mycena vitilis]|nr:hypothetical protein C8R47DRAFT_85905 [Mycena vitilis]
MTETTPEEVPKPTPEAEPVKVEATPTPPETAETKTEVPAAETAIASAPTPAPAPVPAATESPTQIPLEVTPAPTEPAPAAAPPRERELVADPRLSVLRAMFPDFDDSLLQSVLDSVQGDTDRAIDALLGMSDPDYTSEQPPAQQQAPQTQEDLDEQLARTLMLEDERQEHVWRAQQQPQQGQRPQARGQESTAAGQDKDTMQEFQEQFNKFAETGKKTLGTLFSKVKAKIQEFDAPPASSSSSSAPAGSSSADYAYPASSAGPGVGAVGSAQPGRHEVTQRVREQAGVAAYYDPNGGEGGGSAGYDATPTPREMSAAGTTASPPSTNAGAPAIDGGKLGMLPKRPVSLLRTNSPPAGGAPPSSSSDSDELEYAENPFEEGKK